METARRLIDFIDKQPNTAFAVCELRRFGSRSTLYRILRRLKSMGYVKHIPGVRMWVATDKWHATRVADDYKLYMLARITHTKLK